MAAMSLAYELNLTEEEVLNFSIEKFERWVAFFRLKDDNEKAALRRGGKRR